MLEPTVVFTVACCMSRTHVFYHTVCIVQHWSSYPTLVHPAQSYLYSAICHVWILEMCMAADYHDHHWPCHMQYATFQQMVPTRRASIPYNTGRHDPTPLCISSLKRGVPKDAACSLHSQVLCVWSRALMTAVRTPNLKLALCNLHKHNHLSMLRLSMFSYITSGLSNRSVLCCTIGRDMDGHAILFM